MLKELEISGFKSFAKKVVLEFRTPISAIVGPNGSGKSNVAEALRFVLGEQSIKSMRGKKGEDLIFNGATGAPRSNRASVKIVFDNRKKIFDIDFEDITIERVVHRDGTNEYLINGTSVRLKDVLELLSKANIGASGHHIISQGEADRILSVSPKERKAIIEDALGLKIYQYKKEESLRKLAKTEENIKQVESLRREIAPHLKFLRKQVEKIEKMQSMKDELTELYLSYFKRENNYLNLTKEKLENDLRAPLAELEKLGKELADAKAILAREQGSSHTDELARFQAELEERRRKSSEISREMGRLEGEISSVEKNLRRQKEFLARQEATTVPISELKNFESQVGEIVREAEVTSDIGALRGLLQRIKGLLSEFIGKSSGPAVEENELVVQAENEIKNLNANKTALEAEIAVAKENERQAEAAYLRKRDEIEKEKDNYKDAEKEVYRIMARQNELQGVVNDLRHIENRLSIEKTEYESELAEALILIGPAAVRFDDFVVSENGVSLSEEQMATEERRRQEERKREIEKIKIRLEDQGIAGGDDIAKEFKETTERDSFLERELLDLTSSASSLTELIKELEQKLGDEFKSGVAKINSEFKKYFGMMFGGGDAGLELVAQTKRKKKDIDMMLEIEEMPEESEEETEEGIEVNISLPHKKIKGLMMLSGGERALTSIALLFAISQVNPPPFVVLDETDAALDEANSRKYADMVKALSNHSQIVLITHNRETMNSAGILYGVTMGGDGVSRLLSVSFDEATTYAK